MAIPAGTVLLVAAGGVLAYAGFTGANPLEALKDIATGQPKGISSPNTGWLQGIVDSAVNATGSTGWLNGVAGAAGNAAYPGVAALPAALSKYSQDKYSKPKRWQAGYSDCSSFIGKGLKDIGITPPGQSITSSYLASKDWKKVKASDAKPGDIIVSTTHMVCYLGNGQAIGQQNTRRNVTMGSVKDLMYPNTASQYVYLSYAAQSGFAGGSLSSSSSSSSASTQTGSIISV